MDIFKPANPGDIQEVVGWALSDGKKLRVQGLETKSGLGRPVDADAVLDLSALTGITLYEPGELILRAKAGTPLQEIEQALSDAGQQLAFEPPSFAALYGGTGRGTVGGLVAGNLSGARRVKAGALRDHLLGIEAISGRNETFKSGGRVMKNVTGYDLPKLMAGSHGTLAVLTEVTLKVAPAAEQVQTLLVAGLRDREALSVLIAAMQAPLEVSGAAYLPSAVVAKSRQPDISGIAQGIALLRIEGYASSLGARMDTLKDLVAKKGAELKPLAGHGGATVLDSSKSRSLWQEISDASFFQHDGSALWRVSTAPSHALSVVTTVGADAWYADWGGGLIWLSVPAEGSADEEIVRQAVGRAGGHATLIRGPEALRREVPVFHPQDHVHAVLSRNIKRAFDPERILNPGRMYADD